MVISIEKIRLDNALGEGANGFVFYGEDLWLNRPVAVKVWPPRRDRPHTDNDRTDQVLAEARKIANFKNKRIATIYHVDRLPNSGWFYTVMEYIEGVPLADVRASLNDELGLVTRRAIWHHVFEGLDAAERVGIYHGDLHERNVIYTDFLGEVTLIDFGTSVLAGKGHSMRRHARMVNEFAQTLLPEVRDYVPPLDIPNLVRPEYATHVVAKWVEAGIGLRHLGQILSDISGQELARRLDSLARRCSTTLIDIHGPVTMWLANRGISSESLGAYTSAADDALARQKAMPYPPTVGLPLRPVPPFPPPQQTHRGAAKAPSTRV